MRYFTIIISTLLLVILGCEADKTTNPVALNEYQIVLENLPDSVVYLAGEDISIPVSALVLNSDGNLAPNVRVEFVVTSGEGEFDTPGMTTDQHGRVSAVATITAQEGWREFKPMLVVAGGSASGKVAIRGIRQPARIAFDAPNRVFKVASGQSVETTFKAIFSDSNGVGIEGLPVSVGLQDVSEAERAYGAISATSMTNAAGEVLVTFNSLGGFGRVNVYLATNLPGMSEAVNSALTLKVQPITEDIWSLEVRVFPSFHMPEQDVLVTSVIRAIVRNANNVGIPNIVVEFETDMGSITYVTPTDSSGVATADWDNNFEIGVARLLVSIPGTDFEVVKQIIVVGDEMESGQLSISTDVREIFADGGLTVARIRALLKDDQGQALANKLLVFTSTHGAITSPLMTNALGIVDTIFTDVGIPSYDRDGNIVPAKIYVKFDPLHLIDSCEVTISPRNPVAAITLTTTKNNMTAASRDTCTIRATAILQNGAFASPGITIYFAVRGAGGRCEPPVAIVGANGVAETRYTAGYFVGEVIIVAYIINDDDSIVYSNEIRITLLPGPPSNIRVTASPSELTTDDPQGYSTITATVTDTAGNAVEIGTLVRFRATAGSITPATASTRENGIATTRLSPGNRAGLAIVTGTVTLVGGRTISGTTDVNILSSYPNSIRISAEPEVIMTAESGGVSNSTISASVFDSNGDPVNRLSWIIFELPDEPELPDGCTWPNRTRLDSTMTLDGVATITLNAGLRNGPVYFKAYTWRDEERVDTVRVQGYFVTVEGGE